VADIFYFFILVCGTLDHSSSKPSYIKSKQDQKQIYFKYTHATFYMENACILNYFEIRFYDHIHNENIFAMKSKYLTQLLIVRNEYVE